METGKNHDIRIVGQVDHGIGKMLHGRAPNFTSHGRVGFGILCDSGEAVVDCRPEPRSQTR